MFLTEKQWSEVGSFVSSNPGLKEIILKKDAQGNADVAFCGEECFQHKHLRGNVIQFPLDRMAPPKQSCVVGILDGIADGMKDLYIDLGIFLGFLEEDSEKEMD